MGDKKDYWFKRRRFGFGWIPVTKQGWGIVLLFLVLVIGPSFLLSDIPQGEYRKEVGFYLGYVFIVASVLIYITAKKGPKPKWRWGKSPDDNPDEDW
jgi:uncharacterized membrane protein YhaH (DUF805 family)